MGRVFTVEQLNEMKQTLIPVFNDTFSMHLAEITKVSSNKYYCVCFRVDEF